MSDVAALIARWREIDRLARDHDARLVAVSKYAPDAAVAALIDAGARDFGESRPQQLRDRARRWPHCRWHMIGPLQRNKGKYIAEYAASWLSLASLDCARVVARRLGEGRPPLPVMVQVNLAGLPQQSGIAAGECAAFCRELEQWPQLQVVGLMAMVPRDGDTAAAVARLRRLKGEVGRESMRHICVGMSHDYRQALAAGATMIRVGSALFGAWDVRRA
ncbi:MAG: YggS family pyridoxal phosphate-dependent enzyme [Zetaproteobacteria bacterium]|nr:MAG: YggS family pyridoxal phosphate-dependent enzyme [Zetaproteobacteria bacterium]